MKAVVAAFNQEKALVGAFSVITNLRMELFQACSTSFCIAGILALCDEFVPGDPPEYFFDKNPENFSAILEMHRR